MDLFTPFTAGDKWKRSVIPRMITNGMPVLRYALQDLWILASRLSEHKKGSPGLMPFENVEQSRRVFSMWSVIKGQSDNWFHRCDMRNTPQEVSHDSAVHFAY
jgi:hypothetical protein